MSTALENELREVSKETSELKGAYAHLATKADVEKVRSEISSASLRTVLWIVGVGVPTWVGLAIQLFK